MQFNFVDSEPNVKPKAESGRFNDNDSEVITLRFVNRNEFLSDYVRKLIGDWQDAGLELKDLAKRAGIALSMPSQIKKGTGVGRKSLPGLARAFKLTEEQLWKDAYLWWQERGKVAKDAVAGLPLAESPADPEQTKAIDTVRGLTAASDAELRRIVARYSHPDFGGRDYQFWEQTLLMELNRDRKLAAAEGAATKEERKYQRAVRVTAKEKKAAEAVVAVARTSRTPPTRRAS